MQSNEIRAERGRVGANHAHSRPIPSPTAYAVTPALSARWSDRASRLQLPP